ncbi:hypothetical protein CQY20_01990 [Mycolicibacterium agri]|uniref:Membrane protein n=1 Tax=Mycolicibacterium agri TaxID=36811 RepID=A0A2A7NH73_MYCAG|nr:hypothetical protein [Mycolicibacterium agri]PEG42781.1 hypothetical protein CQY20_01990 [Mycolicibacterium agri]GFG52777.1 membrane protein [Mycolicibacterium agri]
MPNTESKGSRAATLAGLALAGLGATHFVKPELFEDLTKQAFPQDTRTYVYIDGGIETAIGLAFAARKTRRLAIIGLLGYGTYLAGNVVRNR